jgi:hypothetical protein
MLYLKIENFGVCPTEGFTLFGATTRRNSDNPNIIGTFGSGAKIACGTLLRNNINPQVFCGLSKLEFFTKKIKVQSANSETPHNQVCVRHSGTKDGKTVNRVEELSFVLDYGTADWTTVDLAVREFVSNAIDGQIDHTGDFNGVDITIVDQSKVRAKEGYTRVFIPLTPDIQNFYNNLGKWFLHFSDPELLKEKILPKDNRNFSEKKTPVLYRRGVYVREITNSRIDSLFDYNLDFKLNESRTLDDYQATDNIGRVWRDAHYIQIARIFNAFLSKENFWEKYALQEYSVTSSDAEERDERKKNWKKAFNFVFGKQPIIFASEDGLVSQILEKKGYVPIPMTAFWCGGAKEYGLPHYYDYITEDDKSGRTFSPATEAVKEVFDIVWNRFDSVGMLNGKTEKPQLNCFYEQFKNESQALGLYRHSTKEIFIHSDISSAKNDQLVWVMVEELVHYLSNGASDFSRDFQTMLVRIIGKLI